jgi:LuxR family maltose regulon positive regulatory protein
MAQWRQELLKAGYRLCWLSVGPDDKTLSAFAAICFAGLARLGIEIDSAMLPIGEAPGQVDRAVAAIVNALAACDDDIHLLIDDYHHVEDHVAHQFLQKLVDHNPGNLHISLASRATPPLSVARLRVMGLLAEIESSDLPFDLDETREFLARSPGFPRLAADETARVHELTGGWPASLQLAAAMRRNRPGEDIDWNDLFWRSSDLPSYLSEEIVAALPPDIAAFMESLSLCRRFSAPLAETLSGRGDAAMLIERIEQDNLLIERDEAEDRYSWYRFHPLFADFLRARLARRDTDEIEALHRRASEWFDSHGLIIEAIHHAAQGGAPDTAASIAERSMPSLWRLSHLGALHHIVNAIPRPLLAANPRLVYLASLTLALTGAPNQAEAWALQIPASDEPEGVFRHLLLKAAIAMQRDDTMRIIELTGDLRKARPASAFEDHILLGFRVTSLAAAGRFDKAYALIDSAPPPADDADGMELLAHGSRCLAMLLEGGVAEALPLAQEFYARHETRRGRYSTGADLGAVAVAYALYETGRIDEARELSANRQHSLKRALPQLMLLSALTEVKLARHDGADDAALALIEAYRERFDGLGFDRGLAHLLAIRIEIAAHRRDLAEARKRLEELREIVRRHRDAAGLRAEIAIVAGCAEARVALLERGYPTALAALDSAAALAAELGREASLVTIDFLRAEIEESRARSEQALDHVRAGLRRGARLGLVRTIVDEGQPALHLLHRALSAGKPEAELASYIQRLIQHFAGGNNADARGPAAGAQVLTPREVEILRLVAASMSNQQIALAIGITLETVKWNLKNVFQKLGVSDRYDAVASARKAGLID